ncbi:hypothetical protein HanRHA438_Chr02g0058091 [Helianthus annuus]|nr:hypothetical protein HanRHA438_Chr02g0058091 [Helianthus annuus]
MPDDLNDDNFALFAKNDIPCDDFFLFFFFAALELIPEGLETEEVEPSAQTVDEVAEAVVTAVVEGYKSL